MLEIRKSATSFNEREMLQLESIILDRDAPGALVFLKTAVYDKIEQSQRGKLKNLLDGTTDPSQSFNQLQRK
ncbi:hypothetical protein [Dehalogenimonas etheniformans]|uniref:Uncharacterized protein n=1 Tax=Dehalogenimonas etheniformans TaxID=1536648 RepID=A0A2P5P6F6_9CHLR|nr:hypothetical protein [Dehalogenimonas etheniformans]PPD57882.1 hypothetical protein JP09_006175 [Dehalogenimonas etheniformans]QNT75465.1 hypothetical protein HX448_01560 [Dehalogenimonas etheniformans]